MEFDPSIHQSHAAAHFLDTPLPDPIQHIFKLLENWLDVASSTRFTSVNRKYTHMNREMWKKRFNDYVQKTRLVVFNGTPVLETAASITSTLQPLCVQFEKLKSSINTPNFCKKAVEEGCTEVVSLLMTHDPHLFEKEPWATQHPLEIAARRQYLRMVRLFVKNANPATRKAIQAIITRGDIKTVQVCLEDPIWIQDPSLLKHVAVKIKDTNMIKLLITSKANIGNILTHVLTQSTGTMDDRTDIVRVLLENQADLQQSSFRHILMLAAKCEKIHIMKLLLAHAQQTIGIPAILNAREAQGDTVFTHAIASGNPESVALLLEHHADLHQVNDQGHTGLIHALKNPNFIAHSIKSNMVTFLLQSKADVNHADANGQTPLMHSVKYTLPHWHAEKWSADFMHILLHHKANVDTQDQLGQTALMLAVHTGLAEGIQLLLAYNADASIEDQSGLTAITYTHNEEIQELLQKPQPLTTSPTKRKQASKEERYVFPRR